MQVRTYHNDPDFKQSVSMQYDFIGGELDSYDYITFYMASGNISSGTIALYGRRYIKGQSMALTKLVNGKMVKMSSEEEETFLEMQVFQQEQQAEKDKLYLEGIQENINTLRGDGLSDWSIMILYPESKKILEI